MICTRCCGFDQYFSPACAARELRRYRRRGPIRSTRRLIAALEAQGSAGATLLDIGGGIGAVQHELMKAGSAAALHVDGSAAYLAAAREEAQRQGYAGRARYLHGDFVEIAHEVEPADIVTLDRVICCYPDMEALVRLSAARARKLYGLVYPRRAWLVRLVLTAWNAAARLRRCPLRMYLHPPREVDRIVRAAGLSLRQAERSLVWEIAVYHRDG